MRLPIRRNLRDEGHQDQPRSFAKIDNSSGQPRTPRRSRRGSRTGSALLAHRSGNVRARSERPRLPRSRPASPRRLAIIHGVEGLVSSLMGCRAEGGRGPTWAPPLSSGPWDRGRMGWKAAAPGVRVWAQRWGRPDERARDRRRAGARAAGDGARLGAGAGLPRRGHQDQRHDDLGHAELERRPERVGVGDDLFEVALRRAAQDPDQRGRDGRDQGAPGARPAAAWRWEGRLVAGGRPVDDRGSGGPEIPGRSPVRLNCRSLKTLA